MAAERSRCVRALDAVWLVVTPSGVLSVKERPTQKRLTASLRAVLSLSVFALTPAMGGNTPNSPAIEVTLVDDDAIAYATFASHNQKVAANREGIFITHVRASNTNYTAQQWRLSQSKDGGKTWRMVHEATHATSTPVIETDAASRLYLAHPDFTNGNTYVQVLTPPSFAFGEPTVIPNSMAGKYSMRLDPTRKQLHYASHNVATLYTLGLDGTLLGSQRLWKEGPRGYMMYPHLALDGRGTLTTAWTTQAKEGKAYYHDIHAMRSKDGGKSWQKLDGTPLQMPVVADETGPTDRISRDDDLGKTTWLAAFTAKDGKLHFLYWFKDQKRLLR